MSSVHISIGHNDDFVIAKDVYKRQAFLGSRKKRTFKYTYFVIALSVLFDRFKCSLLSKSVMLHKCVYEWRSYKAVSYTHLDVYKRQGIYKVVPLRNQIVKRTA